jgi:hypothetical protein
MAITIRSLVFAAVAGLLLPLTALGAGAQGVPSLPLPAPPAAANPTAGTIFDAMLAISRAAVTNPSGAQSATFAYRAAIQQYQAGDLDRARSSALQAIGETVRPPTVHPAPPPPATIPQYAPVPLPPIANVAQADAEEFLALSRRALMACRSQGSGDLGAAQQTYARAVQENLAHRYQDVRRDAQSVINACAPAQRQINAGATPAPPTAAPAAP